MEDLDRDSCPIDERRAVHLGDRPRGKRLWIELPEKLVHRGAELAFDECLGDTGWVGPHIGLQPLELARHVETD